MPFGRESHALHITLEKDELMRTSERPFGYFCMRQNAVNIVMMGMICSYTSVHHWPAKAVEKFWPGYSGEPGYSDEQPMQLG